MPVIPAILVDSFELLNKQIKQVENIFDYAQIDIMDGKFVPTKSFNYTENKNLTEITETKLGFELHLMVKQPLQEIEQWQNNKNVFRVIFHIESQDNPKEIITKIKEKNWKIGIAINPDTPLKKIQPYLDQIDMVLFMTVYPGQQGAPFVPKVGEKIKEFTKIPNHPIIAVDGAVSSKTIQEIKSWGVEIFNVGSALMKVPDINQAHQELKNYLN